jgi:hypothetical protein
MTPFFVIGCAQGAAFKKCRPPPVFSKHWVNKQPLCHRNPILFDRQRMSGRENDRVELFSFRLVAFENSVRLGAAIYGH